MKATGAVVWERGAPWSIEEIEVDGPTEGEVLVEWAAGGLCHSDEHFRSGSRVPAGTDDAMYPMLGGHEGSGVVVEVGPGVHSLHVGDHVSASFIYTCGRCRYCTSGRGNLCNEGSKIFGKGQFTDGVVRHRARGQDLHLMAKLGTFSSHTVVAENSVVKVDPQFSLAVASLVSCGVSTGWGSAVVRAGTQPGDIVVIIGTGGLGISAVQGAKAAGAGEIIAVDPIEFRRDQALKFGATKAVASVADAAPIVADLTWGQGADRVILTPGTVYGDLIRDALDITGKGAVCVVTGMGVLGESAIPLEVGNFALYSKELRGCLFGAMDPRAAAPHLLGLYRQGLLNLDEMITTYPLSSINDAFRETIEGRNIRGLLLPDSSPLAATDPA
jgi:NDMA-dependent alcohol dehydrogenase